MTMSDQCAHPPISEPIDREAIEQANWLTLAAVRALSSTGKPRGVSFMVSCETAPPVREFMRRMTGLGFSASIKPGLEFPEVEVMNPVRAAEKLVAALHVVGAHRCVPPGGNQKYQAITDAMLELKASLAGGNVDNER